MPASNIAALKSATPQAARAALPDSEASSPFLKRVVEVLNTPIRLSPAAAPAVPPTPPRRRETDTTSPAHRMRLTGRQAPAAFALVAQSAARTLGVMPCPERSEFMSGVWLLRDSGGNPIAEGTSESLVGLADQTLLRAADILRSERHAMQEVAEYLWGSRLAPAPGAEEVDPFRFETMRRRRAHDNDLPFAEVA